MFKHVLVPLDGSTLAEAALPAATYLAERLNAQVTLLHVLEKNPPAEIHGQPHLATAAEAEAYLKGLIRNNFSATAAVTWHVHAPKVSNVADSIIAHSDELHHDLVVISTHGRGKALHLFLGSIAQRVIAGGSLPVLILHPPMQGSTQHFLLNRIMVPLDGRAGHGQSLPVGHGLAEATGASLRLAMVIPSMLTLSGEMSVASRMLPGTTAKLLEMAWQDAEEFLRTQVGVLRTEGIETSALLLQGDPAKQIVEAARREAVDLLVLATHGKSGLAAFWSGSVAHKVCSICQIPLLLVPLDGRE